MEGEAEKPEATVPWNGVKGVSVYQKGKAATGGAGKNGKDGRRKSNKMEEKVDRKSLGDEGAEVQGPKTKVIRVESEETQDYVSREEAEEICFVPSAISIPRGPMLWCDNRCRDKALRFWQLASVVVDDGEEVRTVNLCPLCYNESLTARGLASLKNSQLKAVVEKKAHRGTLRRMLEKDQKIQGM